MDNILVEFRYLDDTEQPFPSAHLPAMPRVGDVIETPPPHERAYRVAAVSFQCAGRRAGETVVIVDLRRHEAVAP